jgi:hypothetical protein
MSKVGCKIGQEEIDFQISASFPEGYQSNDKTFIMVVMGIEFASSMQQNTAYVVKDKGTMTFVGCF